MSSTHPSSPPWGTATKALVALIGMALVGALLFRLQAIVPLLVVAGILTYLILPLIRLLHLRARLPWGLATNLCFLVLVVLIAAVSTATGLAIIQQLQALFFTVQHFLFGLPEQLQAMGRDPLFIGPFEFDLAMVDLGVLADQALAALQPVLGRMSTLLTGLATVALESLGRMIFVLAIAYFISMDFERVRSAWRGLSIPGYEQDLRRLQAALARIWNAFLRGQLLVAVATGTLTGLLMAMLGVRFSLGLGVLTGLSKFVPILGPFVAGAIAGVVAVFQPTNWLGLSPLTHMALVIGVLFVLNQIIDYVMLPRIMGDALNLHPVLVLVGAILGASLAGVIGLLLSAPSVATLLLLGRYTYRKMLDLDPWNPPIDATSPAAEVFHWAWLTRRLRRHGDVKP